MTTSLAYQQATAPGGIGLEQMNQNIINFLAGNPDRATSEAAMAQYGVSDEDIRRATGKSFSDYYPTIGALPGALSATESPLSLVTSSADERQQGAIDAATTKPAEEFGTYRGIKMPTFSPIYGFQEDSGTIVQTPEQQTQAWMTEQDRLASLTPAQKAIEAAKYTYESGDNVFDTAYSPITFGGKTWQPGSDGRTLGRLADDQSGLGPKQYRYEVMDAATGQISQGVGVEGPSLFQKFLTNPVTGMVLSMALPGVGSAIGGALGITSPALAQAVGSAAVKFGLQVAGGKDPIEALKNVAVAEAMQGVSSAVGSMVPAELASVGKQVVTQLITTGQIDPVALATTAGADYAAGQLATQTGMNKSDALKLINAGVQVASGNIVGAGTSLISSAIQNTSKQAQQAFVDAKNSGATDAEAFEAASVIDPRISGQGVSGSQFEDYGGRDVFRGGLQNVSDTLTGGLGNDTVSGGGAGTDTVSSMLQTGMKIDPNTGLPIDPETGEIRVDVSGTSDTEIEDREGVDVGSTFGGGTGTSVTATTPAAQKTLTTLGGILGLGTNDPNAVYTALFGGATGDQSARAIFGLDALTNARQEIEIMLDDPELPEDARNEMSAMYAELVRQETAALEADQEQFTRSIS